MKIKLLVWCEGIMPEQFEETDDFTAYENFDNFVAREVNNNKLLQSFEKDHPLNKMESIEFEVPDDLSEQLIFDVCSGKSCSMWFEHQIDFHKDYYASWTFVEKNGKWEKFK
jgi:hypothetical protein